MPNLLKKVRVNGSAPVMKKERAYSVRMPPTEKSCHVTKVPSSRGTCAGQRGEAFYLFGVFKVLATLRGAG